MRTIKYLILLLLTITTISCRNTKEHKSLKTAVTIAEDGVPMIDIITSPNAIPAEKTAAAELADYLKKITGAEFTIIEEKNLPTRTNAVYIGNTSYARSLGIDIKKLGKEEAIIRTIDGNLILSGGRPRGTIYALYIFLEDVLGCRWYSPFVEKIPKSTKCSIKPLHIQTKPTFVIRDAITWLPARVWSKNQKKQWYVYTVRNRLNGINYGQGYCWGWKSRQVPKLITGGDAYGGVEGLTHGGPHTFNSLHFPEDKYFKKHPEWFSMRDGKRVPPKRGIQNHLCLTNKELRKAYIEKLKNYMRTNPDLKIFSVAQNDGGRLTACDCPECTAFAMKTSWTDLHIDFINELADGIKNEFPENQILTLAYSYSTLPPKKIKTNDNVIVDITSFASGKVTLPECEKSKKFTNELIADWSKFCSNIWVWDYQDGYKTSWVPFNSPIYFRMQEQYRFAKNNNVTKIFAENMIGRQFQIVPEFYHMRLWLFAKLTENPNQDIWKLIKDFMNGYYGKAGKYLLEYIKMQHERLALWPERMVNLNFINKMQDLYDKAEYAVKNNPEVLGRVKDARICADITTIFYKNKIANEFVKNGNNSEKYPYKSAMLKKRIINQLNSTKDPFWHRRFKGYKNYFKKKITPKPLTYFVKDFVEKIASGEDYAPLPKQFKDLPTNKIIDIPGYRLHRYHHAKNIYLKFDPDSPFGAVSGKLSPDELPLTTGIEFGKNKELLKLIIREQDIPGKGYNLYKIGRTKLFPDRSIFFFTNSWRIQMKLNMFFNPLKPNQQYDVFISVKFDGPAYPYGNPKNENGVYVDRLILIEVDD